MTIFDHLWQSSWVAVVVFLLALLFRDNSARVRYGLWLAASLKFLLPFSALTALGSRFFVHTVPAAPMAVLTSLRPAAMPFSAAAPATHHLPWLTILVGVWALGVVAVTGLWLVRWYRLDTIARGAQPLPLDLPIPVRMTPALLEPGLVGIWRPVILLPDGIFQQLSRNEIDTVLRHELCHHARRDNLMAALHMVVEALFWFHPLVWFIGARLVEEREAACDESVLANGQNPLEYAQAILQVCRLYLRSPLPCASGVAGADLGRRVDAIMARRDLDDVDTFRKMMLAGLLLVSIAIPLVTGGLRTAPPEQLIQRLATVLLPPAPVVAATPVAVPAPRAQAPRRAAPVLAATVKVEASTVRAPALPDLSSLIVITAPPLDLDTPAPDDKVCRPPQQMGNSRLMGPQVCLSQREWDRMAEQHLVLLPDGKTLAANYGKDRAMRAGACSPRSLTNGTMHVDYGSICF